jgi:hypothetical protein
MAGISGKDNQSEMDMLNVVHDSKFENATCSFYLNIYYAHLFSKIFLLPKVNDILYIKFLI